MPDYHLTWDKVGAGFSMLLEVAPDDGTSISGALRSTVNGVQGPEQLLTYGELVPKWSYKIAANESVHVTLTLAFHTAATSKIGIKATCKAPDGSVYEAPPYDESYSGQNETVNSVFVWANP